MDQEAAEALQLEQELATGDEDASAAAARAERLDIHTQLPGIVQEFDSAALTVRVRPAIKRLWFDAGFLVLPDIVNVPVQFPRFGGFIIIGPIAVGDEGLIHFSERAIDNWYHAGGVQEPSEYRLHDLSDGFFAPGYMSKGKAAEVVGGAPADALEIRTLDGNTVMRLRPGVIELGGDATPLTPLLDGVVHGRGIDTLTGLTYAALGSTSSIVRAKK